MFGYVKQHYLFTKCSLIPRPRPAFHHLQYTEKYRKAGEGLVSFLTYVSDIRIEWMVERI